MLASYLEEYLINTIPTFPVNQHLKNSLNGITGHDSSISVVIKYTFFKPKITQTSLVLFYLLSCRMQT